MKFYLLMTSFALTAGLSLGYWTGQGSAETEFAQGCADQGFIVVYDHRNMEPRHFHCFELQLDTTPEPREKQDTGGFVVL